MRIATRFSLILLAVGLLCGCRPVSPRSELSEKDLHLVRDIQRHAFGYFTNAVGANGLIQDRLTNRELSSTMAAGFQLTCYCIAAENEWVSRQTAARQVLKILQTYESLPRFHGMFAHFYHIDSGEVVPFMHADDDGADVSETGFMIAGALTCRSYFTRDTPMETTIRETATRLYEDVEWNWMLQDASGNMRNTLSWHWSPAKGFNVGSSQRVQSNLELSSMITYLLAMSSPTHPIPYSCWNDGWCRRYVYGTYDGHHFITRPALFNHQYAQIWLDLRNSRDRHADYFRNSTYASLANCSYCTTNLYPTNYIWGLTFCDGPFGYETYGYPPKEGPIDIEATIAPTGPGGSFVFTPAESLKALRYMRTHYPMLWGPFGFRDAFSPRLNWFDQDYIAIDQGPLVMMPENYLSEFIWDTFMADTNLIHTMDQIGFVGIIDDMENSSILPAGQEDGHTSVFPDNKTQGGLATYCNWKPLHNCVLTWTTDPCRFGNRALSVNAQKPGEQAIALFPANRNLQRYRYLSFWFRGNCRPIVTLRQEDLIGQCKREAEMTDGSGWKRVYFRMPAGIIKGNAELRIHAHAGETWFLDDITLCNQVDVQQPTPPSAFRVSNGIAPGDILLSWSTPPKLRPYRYILRIREQQVRDGHTEPDTTSDDIRIHGSQTNWIVSGLQPGKEYSLTFYAEALSGNLSAGIITNITIPNKSVPEAVSLLDIQNCDWQAYSQVYTDLQQRPEELTVDYHMITEADRWSYLEGILHYHNLAPFENLVIDHTGAGRLVPKLWISDSIQQDVPLEKSQESGDGRITSLYNLARMDKTFTQGARKLLLFIETTETNISNRLTITEMEVLR